MRQQTQEYIDNLEAAYEDSVKQNAQSGGETSMFESPSEENLIRWQLDLKEDMNRIYHLLNGHKPYEAEDGSIKYKESDNEDSQTFNDQGVNLIMNIMSFYLNRNTLLSNYDNDTINWKVSDFMDCLLYTSPSPRDRS